MDTLSGILFFAAFLPYIWAILHHQTVPSPVTWGIWAGIDTLALLAMKKKDAAIGQVAGGMLGAWIVTVLALIFGKTTIGGIKVLSILGAVIGIVLWKSTGSALLAIICSQVATLVASFPEFAIGYKTPQEEDPIAWSIWLVSCICALLAIKKWDLANALQPLTFTTIEIVMVILVVIRPHVFL